VSELIAALNPGEVVSYGEVAAWAGRPGAARAVGQVLAHSEGLPWWRVVTASGRLTPGHESTQARRLAAENVTVSGSRVVGFAGRRRQSGPDAATRRSPR
jgi:methylated-DNA-protein-cysteine methyltransferase-like protein